MADEYLEGIIKRSDVGEVYYTYTPQQEEARNQLIALIEAEKRDYMARIEPYIKQLSNIQGTPHIILKTSGL